MAATIFNNARDEWLKRLRIRLGRADWRIWAVLAAVLVVILVTAIIYLFKIGLDPATHFGAVFAGWVGGVALFVVAGAVVAIVSLARPEEESFDSRARILFRRQTGKHIDYIINRIGAVLEQYAEYQAIKITVESYHRETKRYRITLNNETVVRGYIDDIPSHYKSEIEYKEVTLPPPGEAPNALVFVRVQGNPLGRREEFTNEISRDVTTILDPDESSKVEFQIGYWVAAEVEPNSCVCVALYTTVQIAD
jgi:hypothetical protein